MESDLKLQSNNTNTKHIDIQPNTTLYVNNLNEKLKVDGKFNNYN
jgi:hypothetical protein